MTALFDNLDDVCSKFVGTVVYYNGKPVNVKSANVSPDKKGEFQLLITSTGAKAMFINLTDPALNYRDYNIGYANVGTNAPWWYRLPQKQYAQGLKRQQLGCKFSNEMAGLDENFNFSGPYIKMLENVYPSIGDCAARLHSGNIIVSAFHRDFAMSWDKIHEDHILEYRGTRIGTLTGPKLTNGKLIPEFAHLKETIQEAMG